MATTKPHEDPGRIISNLKALVDKIEQARVPEGSRKSVHKSLLSEISRLEAAAGRLDPILKPRTFFDPGNPQTAGHMVALAAIAQPRHRLSALKHFYGSGVYALYYNGEFDAYKRVSRTEQPIYVGKADPQVPNAKDAATQGLALYRRLTEHSRNIRKAIGTLDVEDFECRFLVVQSGYQGAAERYLIDFFKPIWNSEVKICYGIGKHGDSSSTRANKRSPWDTLHPGRNWARSIAEDQKSEEQIRREIDDHFRNNAPYETLQDVLAAFLGDLRQLAYPGFTTASGQEVNVEEQRG